MESLLDQFLTEEVSPFVRNLILEAVTGHQKGVKESQQRFEFNRFELTLDFENGQALIEDVLRPGKPGELRVDLNELLRHLGKPDLAAPR